MTMPQIAITARPRLIQPDQRPCRLNRLMVSTASVVTGAAAARSACSTISTSWNERPWGGARRLSGPGACRLLVLLLFSSLDDLAAAERPAVPVDRARRVG